MKTLLDNGTAYHCFCTDKRLNLLRREAMKLRQVPKYDNRCRHLKLSEVQKRLENNEEHCIRFKVIQKNFYIKPGFSRNLFLFRALH